MERLHLTKRSLTTLSSWHEGAGHAFMSAGNRVTTSFPFRFIRTTNGHYIVEMGNKQIRLSSDQIAEIGSFAIEFVND